MSQKSRREMIEELLAAEPHDVFLRYGLAMEYSREGNSDEAVTRLRALIADVPNYVPAYFQAAQITLQDGDALAAAELLRAGITAATAQGNSHAAQEMDTLLSQIE